MKPKEVLKLLNCSYTTLNNYVKKGKLKYSESSSKRHDYDDSSVYELYDSMCGRKKLNNRIDVFIHNNKYEFNVPENIISDVLEFIVKKIKEKENLT